MEQKEDFLSEVERELKDENFFKTVRKVFPYLLWLSALIIAAVTIYVIYEKNLKENLTKESIAFAKGYDLLQNKHYEDAIKTFEKITQAKNDYNYRALALLSNAVALKNQGKEVPNKLYEEIASNKKFDIVFRDFASLKIASNLIDIKDFLKAEEVLKTLIEPSRPFYQMAKEQLAILFISKNDKEKAKAILKELAEDPKIQKDLAEHVKVLTANLE